MLSKKGTAQDFVMIFVWLMVILTVLLIVKLVGGAVMENTDFANAMLYDSNGTEIEAVAQAQDSWTLVDDSGFNDMFVGMYFLLHIAEIILAAALPVAGPLLLGLNILMIVIMAVFSGMFQSVLSGIFYGFNLTNMTGAGWIIEHFVLLEIGFMLILAFVVYKSSGNI